jgi:transposase-like protein
VHPVEISVMEQRYHALMVVIQDGWKVAGVAPRVGVVRQSVHNWIVLYEEEVGSVVVYERASMHPGRRLRLEADVTSLDRPTGSSESLEQVRPTTPQTRHPQDDEVAVVGQVRVASA